MLMIFRNLLMGLVVFFLVYLSFLSRSEWVPMHAWNRAFADVSFLLLVLTLIIGPLSKIHRHFYRYLSWRRELGIWCAATAILHVYVLFNGWFQWQPIRLIIGVNQDSGRLTFDPGFTLANILGFIGLSYVLLLALISNKHALNFFGKAAWDYLQQKSHILYVLVITHTTFFLFLFRIESENWLEIPFIVIVCLIFIIQWLAFFKTVYKNKLYKED